MSPAGICATAEDRGRTMPATIPEMARGNGLDVILAILEDAACPIRTAAAQERA